MEKEKFLIKNLVQIYLLSVILLFNTSDVFASKTKSFNFIENPDQLKIYGTVTVERGNFNETMQNSLSSANFENKQAQQRTITGKVTGSDGVSIPGVTILVKGTTTGTVTDANGNYSLVIPKTADVIVFSFIGLKTQEITIGTGNIYNVVLSESVANLDELVVVGYGAMSREMLTTSISKLDNQVLENIPYTNVAASLQGNLPGVRVQTRSGQPGATPLIVVRGGTSINNPDGANPLYVVDGAIRSDISNINADDIESIQVLKDAASTAIYGARGSNGVVIVETKSGIAGQTEITYRYDMGIGQVGRKLDLLLGEDFVYYARMGIYNALQFRPEIEYALNGNTYTGGIGNDLTNKTHETLQEFTPENKHKLQEGWQSMPDPIDPTRTLIFKSTDWQKVMHRTAYSHNHFLNVSGGSEKVTFNLGLGYLNAMGTAQSTDYERVTVNLSSNFKVNNNINVFGKFAYSNREDRAVGKEIDYFKNYQILAPTVKRYFEDGTIAPGQSMNFANPEYLLNEVYVRRNNFNDLSMIVGARWQILQSLIFEPQISLYQTNSYGRSFTKEYLDGPNRKDSNRPSSGYYGRGFNPQADAVLTYLNSFDGDHNLDVKVGMSYLQRDNISLSASGRYAATDLIPTLNASADPTGAYGDESQQILIGYFSRVNYNYKQKYLLTANVRYDGASNVGSENKWGVFPGISAGWNIHNEDFWSDVMMKSSISTLKLRASYGVNGNISGLGLYQAQGTYATGANYVYVGGLINTVMANQSLQWERSKTFNVGLDLGLFKNRVSLLLDVYRRETDNLLTNLPMPYSTGFTTVLTNYGSLENKGIEVDLDVSILPPTSPFNWNVSFNYANVANKILKLPDNGIENNRVGGEYLWDPEINDYRWQGGLQEGGRIGDQFAFKELGVWESDAAAKEAPYLDKMLYDRYPKNYVIQGGDIIWQDTDGNDTIDVRDKIYAGNIYPTITGGFTSSFGYKNIVNLVIRMDYTLGHTINYETGARLEGNFSGNNALSTALLRSWKKDGDITDVPKVYFADAHMNLRKPHMRYMQKGDFLCLREVTLSYNVPRRIINRYFMNNLRINVTGHNLHYFTAFEGLNPEAHGIDQAYPNTRTITFGASLTF